LYPGAPLKNNHFYGGTLWGITEKLDYFKSLGVNTLYLSPIFDAASNHKYDTGDYMSIDSMFGGEEAFLDLLAKAKEKGIGIILDGVFNHTGSDSLYFNREGHYDSVGAYQSPMSDYFTWYDFQDFPNKYTSWWGIDILPRIHPDKPSCRKYFVGKGGVIEKYARLGIDGFRLDVADELSDNFIAEIKKKLNCYNKESVLYGEVWEDASNKIAYDVRKKYYLGNELDGVMNYPVRKGIIDYLTTYNSSSLAYALTDVIDNAPKRIRDMQMNLLGTHDTERILTVLGGERSDGRSNEYLSQKKMNDLERGTAKRRLRMAYVILATIPGIPAIFYGDEAGLEGYHDPFNRLPYPWGREDNNLINYFRMIGSIRQNNEVYKEGEFKLLYIDPNVLAYERIDKKYAYITLVNNSKQYLRVEFSSPAIAMVSDDNKQTLTSFDLPAYTAQIFKIERDNYIYF
jgi:glycosidase